MIRTFNRSDRLYRKAWDAPEVLDIAREKYRTVGKSRCRDARISQLHVRSAPEYSGRFRDLRIEMSREKRSQKILDIRHLTRALLPAPQFSDHNRRKNDGVVALHYRRKFFERSLLAADIVDNRVGIEYVRTRHRILPPEFLDPFIPSFAELFILSDHFFDTPPPKTDNALAGSKACLSIKYKCPGIVLLRLAHEFNCIIGDDKVKMNRGDGWCNINNPDIPRLWAARWKK